MKLYDSLTNSEKTINKKKINIYNCGPTVYNHIHIGNARPLIVFDVLFRLLTHLEYDVTYLHNLTDIDDKIINAAEKEGIFELDLSNKYAIAYEKVRHDLNIKEMQIEKVSDNIQGIIDYIDELMKKNIAYEVNGNVYFNTKSIDNYGVLSHRHIDEQYHGERVDKDDNKLNETDFVLWKKTDKGLQWDTKWSTGRPGWHTECVYLINKYFKDTLTIHGGGIDLKFPHHENENAQHYSLNHKHLAEIWMHVGHINVNKQKMSKSLNNFILVKDLLLKYSYQAIRWFMYQSNYRNPLDFSIELMDNNQQQINKINKTINIAKTNLIMNDALVLDQSLQNNNFIDVLSNDLNITNAITIMLETVKNINNGIKQKNWSELNKNLNELINGLNILGISFDDLFNEQNISLIKQYKHALDNKDYETSDKLRAELIAKGLL